MQSVWGVSLFDIEKGKETRVADVRSGSRFRVVIADDVLENRELLRRTIEPEGFDAFLVPSGEVAVDVTSKVDPDLVLLDICMPGIGGFEAARRLRENEATKSIPLIFITVDSDIESLVRAFQAGAVDYIVKPFTQEEVLARVRTHVELYRLRRELEREVARRKEAEEEREKAKAALNRADEQLSFFTAQEARRWGIEGFIGQSASLERVVAQVRKVQQSDSISVIVSGESGVGKELIARAIHYGSARSERPFVPLNCSAIPKELAESLLFGHVKGSFSGAVKDQKGHFELAEGGTLFLDELGELPLDLQAKLLRVLEGGVLLPIGATIPIETNVRVIAATHRSLQDEIVAGRFREDLYYRMARFSIDVPPLRERKEDIPLLTAHFLERFSSEMGRQTPSISEAALVSLAEHDYPGNIRELKNVVERAAIESQESGSVEVEHLYFSSRTSRRAMKVEADVSFEKKASYIELLTDEESRIIRFIEDSGRISNGQCRDLLNVNIHKANYLLSKLTKVGRLRRLGSNRNSTYVLVQ